MKFNTKVESATWQEEEGRWKLIIVSTDGTRSEDYCEILVNGSGALKFVRPNSLAFRGH